MNLFGLCRRQPELTCQLLLAGFQDTGNAGAVEALAIGDRVDRSTRRARSLEERPQIGGELAAVAVWNDDYLDSLRDASVDRRRGALPNPAFALPRLSQLVQQALAGVAQHVTGGKPAVEVG